MAFYYDWRWSGKIRWCKKTPLTPKNERPRCGARTRCGAPCQARAVWCVETNQPRNGRCRMHGGLSTGPKTDEGRAAVATSNRERSK